MTPIDDTRPFPNLATPRLALRSLCAEDAPELHRIWTDPAVTEHLVLEPFTSLEETEGMMRVLTDLWGFRQGIRWVLEHRGRVLGTCGFHNLKEEHRRGELGYEMTPEAWDAVVQVHLYGGYNVTRAAWPHFREQSFGRVVVATSTSGLFGNFGQANYGAAKLGLVGLINTLAQEGAKYNIKTNAVAPLAATRMTEDILPPEVLKSLTPEYVAPVVAYLCTEEVPDTASVYIVGGGKVQRTALFQNDGITFGAPPSVDDIAARWSEIDDLSDAKQATFNLR